MTLNPRRLLASALLLVSASALAGWWEDRPAKLLERLGSSPLAQVLRPVQKPGVRPSPRPHGRAALHSELSLSGRVYAVHAVSLDGQETETPAPPELDLSDPIPVDAGAVALVLEIDGPVQVREAHNNGGHFLAEIHPQVIHVVLEDPERAAEAGQVLLSLDEGWERSLDDALLAVAD